MRSIFCGRRIPTRGFFVGGKNIKIYLLVVVGKFGLFSRDFDDFFNRKPTNFVKKSPNSLKCRREKNTWMSKFFPVRNIFSSSEDQSPIEYTAHGLTIKQGCPTSILTYMNLQNLENHHMLERASRKTRIYMYISKWYCPCDITFIKRVRALRKI